MADSCPCETGSKKSPPWSSHNKTMPDTHQGSENSSKDRTDKPYQWLSTYHAAKFLDITPRQLINKVHRGIIKASRIGPRRGRLRFDEREIRRYQDSHPLVGRKEGSE